MIDPKTLTIGQLAAISNTICGEAEAVKSLAELGLVEVRNTRRLEDGTDLTFFDLTPEGKRFVDRHFTVPDRRERQEGQQDRPR